jgi:hypothetical protein
MSPEERKAFQAYLDAKREFDKTLCRHLAVWAFGACTLLAVMWWLSR